MMKLMTKLWGFFREKRNREILAWLGGGIVIAISGIWAAALYLFPPGKSHDASSAHVEASCGSVAIGGDVTGANVTAGATYRTDCSTKSK